MATPCWAQGNGSRQFGLMAIATPCWLKAMCIKTRFKSSWFKDKCGSSNGLSQSEQRLDDLMYLDTGSSCHLEGCLDRHKAPKKLTGVVRCLVCC